MTQAVMRHYHRWIGANERERVLQVVQPALVGLIDGTVSTLAPIFASAYLSGSHTALFVGLATALGGGSFHALPFLISDVNQALVLAYTVVAIELVVIALIRKRFLRVSLASSLVQVTLGGAIVAGLGFALGQA